MTSNNLDTYTLHYVSADGPGPDATWSVYREQYASPTASQPFDGTQEWVSQHASEAEANREASRLSTTLIGA